MNTKLILAVLLVALIGVVAGTYQITNNADTTNTFAPVETEDVDDSEIETASDSSGSGSSGIGLGSGSGSDGAVSSVIATSLAKSGHGYATSNPSSNPGSSSSSSGGSGSHTNDTSTTNDDNTPTALTDAELQKKAEDQSVSLGGSGAHVVTEDDVNGKHITTYALTDSNGNVIGEAEYDQYGTLTGGAWSGEVDAGD